MSGRWAQFDAAVERAAAGDLRAASAAAARFAAGGPRGPALALRGFLDAAAGDGRRALRRLSRAARLAPREAWIHDWLAEALFAAGDRPAARAALLRAFRAGPTAARALAVARVCEQLGFIKEARRWAERSRRRRPTAEAHAFVGLLWDRHRQYARSAQEYALALALAPGDPGLELARSQALALGGDLAQALRLAPRSPEPALRLWRGQLEALAGRRLSAPDAFTRGYAHLAARRWGRAAAEFAKVEGPFARKGRFYLTVARLLEGSRPPDVPGLVMIGLGVDPPYSATAEALRHLTRCDVIFNNVAGTEVAELLWPFCRDVRPTLTEVDRLGPLAESVLAEARKGRRVGFVTRGAALVFGKLGDLVSRRAEAEGLPWSCLPAVGSADFFEARFGGPARGAGILSGAAPLRGRRLEPSVPWTVFVPDVCTKTKFSRLCAELSSRFGARRPVLFFDHKVGQEPIRATLRDLPKHSSKLSRAAMLRVMAPGERPPRGKGAELLLIGLGPCPLEHATIEGLEALGRAAAVYAEGLAPAERRLLERLGAVLVGEEGLRRALKAGRTGAFVTPHHPLRFAGARLRALEAVAAPRSLPAVSAESLGGAVAGVPLGTRVHALQSFEAGALERGEVVPDPAWPCVVYDARSRRVLVRP